MGIFLCLNGALNFALTTCLNVTGKYVHHFAFFLNFVRKSIFLEVTSGTWESCAIFMIEANILRMASHQCLCLIFEGFGI